jgi:ABC-type multidrug transport system fused ATPase/permease subunit
VSEEHTLGEIVRRLDEVSRRLDEVSTRLEQRQSQMEAAYVRKDVFEAVQQADGVQLRGIESEMHSLSKRMDAAATATQVQTLDARMTRTEDQRRTDRNLLLASLVFPLVLLLVGVLITSGSLG